MRKNYSGFTVVELIVVIVVVILLATIAATSYVSSQATARDTKRKTDLASIGEAIQLYRQKYGNDATIGATGKSCGSGGSGWFNYATGATGAYQYSTLSCLQDAGYLDSGGTFVDPSGCTTNGGSSAGSVGPCRKYDSMYPAYMKYSYGSGDNTVTCLYAHLENEDHSSEMTSTSPCSVTPTLSSPTGSYKMNYMLVVK